MSTDLSPENEAFLEEEVAAGVFSNLGEGINAGVEFLRQRKALLAHLDEGRRQLDDGDYSEFDEQSLKEYFDDVHGRGIERLRASEGRP